MKRNSFIRLFIASVIVGGLVGAIDVLFDRKASPPLEAECAHGYGKWQEVGGKSSLWTMSRIAMTYRSDCTNCGLPRFKDVKL